MKLNYLITVLFTVSLITNNHTIYSQGCLPEGITFTTQQQIDNFQTNYPGCVEIEGGVLIEGTDISNLDGLLVLNSIGNDLEIGWSYNLTTLYGLDSLNYIGGDLRIWSNISLVNFDGLNSLITIGGRFLVYDSYDLKNFEGLESLKSIGDHFYIEQNDDLESLLGLSSLDSLAGLTILQNPEFKDLSGLVSLTHLDALYIVKNISLNNLTGLEVLNSIDKYLSIHENVSLKDISALSNTNLDSIMELHVIFNDSLSVCEIQSICDFLSNSIAIVDIHDNASGCNSREEVEDACPIGINEASYSENDIRIFPNPAKKSITIESSSKILSVSIFDQTGQEVLKEKSPGTKVDVSARRPGLYFVEIETEFGAYREKLVIQ